MGASTYFINVTRKQYLCDIGNQYLYLSLYDIHKYGWSLNDTIFVFKGAYSQDLQDQLDEFTNFSKWYYYQFSEEDEEYEFLMDKEGNRYEELKYDTEIDRAFVRLN